MSLKRTSSLLALMLLPFAASAMTVHDFTVTVTQNTPVTFDLFSLGIDGYSASVDHSQYSTVGYNTSSGTTGLNPAGGGLFHAAGSGILSLPDQGSGTVVYTPAHDWLSTDTDPSDVFWYRIFNLPDSSNLAKVEFVVTPPPPSCSLSATPSSVVPGESTTLSWTSANANGVFIDNGVGFATPLIASSTMLLPAATTLYTLTATSTTATTTCTVTVTLLDIAPPVITVLGDNPLTLTAGDTFTDPGFTATDDTAVTATSTSGTVDTNTVGAYILTYTASDAAGNTATSTRTVQVDAAPEAPAPAPVVSSGGSRHSGSGRVVLATTTLALAPTGEVLGASTYHFTRQLGRGDTGADVIALQQFLADKGFFSGAPTGYFGALTHQAVLAFQLSRGVVGANGHVGPATLQLLNEGNLPPVAADIRSQLAAAYSALQALLALVGT